MLNGSDVLTLTLCELHHMAAVSPSLCITDLRLDYMSFCRGDTSPCFDALSRLGTLNSLFIRNSNVLSASIIANPLLDALMRSEVRELNLEGSKIFQSEYKDDYDFLGKFAQTNVNSLDLTCCDMRDDLVKLLPDSFMELNLSENSTH
jgi:hypothetical protein